MQIPYANQPAFASRLHEEEIDSSINQHDNHTNMIISTRTGRHVEEDREGEEGNSSTTLSSRKTRCSKLVKKRVPILSWLPTYGRGFLVADLVAGCTVGLTVVPQSMAYAAIAGLTPEFGLYSSYVGCFLYVIFGSCRQVTIGPTAVMGLLTFETCGSDFPACAVLTAFYSGLFELGMALLHLGWVVSFISEPVVLGFTSGAATTIISSQIKPFLGLQGPKGSGFLGYWDSILRSWDTIQLGDTVTGLSSFVLLILLRELKTLSQNQNQTQFHSILSKFFWFISVSRNILIIMLATLIAFLWPGGSPPFALTGPVTGGFPPIAIPSFALPFNSTTSVTTSFLQSWSKVGPGPLIVALISILQNVAISKAFSRGQSIDATQEMLALGVSNMCGSFFSAIPISGSFSRSAVNEASGVRSQLGGLFTGLIVLLSLAFLTPTFYYIPKASLAAVIISAVMVMIEFQPLLVMWKINWADLLSYLVTFSASVLLGMEYGIMLGVSISLGLLLIKSLKPGLHPELRNDPGSGVTFIYVRPDAGIHFPSVDHIRNNIMKLAHQFPDVSILVINFEKWTTLDYTVVTALSALVSGLHQENNAKPHGNEVIFVECSPSWIHAFQSISRLNPTPHICSLQELGDYLAKKNNHQLFDTRNNATVSMPPINPDELVVVPSSSSSQSILIPYPHTTKTKGDKNKPANVHPPPPEEEGEESLNPLLSNFFSNHQNQIIK